MSEESFPLPENAVKNPDGFFMTPEGHMYNEAGYCALKFRKQQRIIVTCVEHQYVFAMRANICMAWIRKPDVQCCLGKRLSPCCGASKKAGMIMYANESDARRWTNGGGR